MELRGAVLPPPSYDLFTGHLGLQLFLYSNGSLPSHEEKESEESKWILLVNQDEDTWNFLKREFPSCTFLKLSLDTPPADIKSASLVVFSECISCSASCPFKMVSSVGYSGLIIFYAEKGNTKTLTSNIVKVQKPDLLGLANKIREILG